MMVHILSYCVQLIRKPRNIIFLILGVIFIGLWFALHYISQLSQERDRLLQQNGQLNISLALKTQQLKQEREITQRQVIFEQQQREKMNDDVKIIYKTIKNDQCSHQPLPNDVLKRLRQ